MLRDAAQIYYEDASETDLLANLLGQPKQPMAFGQVASMCGQSVVKTLTGEKQLQELQPGDRILTRDNGYQAVRWVGCFVDPETGGNANAHILRISAGALGDGLPSRDLVLSERQRILAKTGYLRTVCGANEASIRLADLKHMDGIDPVAAADAQRGWQVLLARHELILANDVWTETFRPDEVALGRLDAANRKIVHSLCPRLDRGRRRVAFPPARSEMKLKFFVSGNA